MNIPQCDKNDLKRETHYGKINLMCPFHFQFGPHPICLHGAVGFMTCSAERSRCFGFTIGELLCRPSL